MFILCFGDFIVTCHTSTVRVFLVHQRGNSNNKYCTVFGRHRMGLRSRKGLSSPNKTVLHVNQEEDLLPKGSPTWRCTCSAVFCSVQWPLKFLVYNWSQIMFNSRTKWTLSRGSPERGSPTINKSDPGVARVGQDVTARFYRLEHEKGAAGTLKNWD